MRKLYDEELNELNTLLIEMGAMIERAIANALDALEHRDTDKALDVVLEDRRVDEMERKIEDLSISLLLRQQPVAGDLRFISSALKIVTDLGRIGDHAQDICEISLTLPPEPLSVEINLIKKMYDEAASMIKMAVDAFITKDEDLAHKCINHDDVVDALYRDCRSFIIDSVKESKGNEEELLDLLQIAKYLERVGDHAENIAQWVIYSITGQHDDYEASRKSGATT
ncbi:MAG: phosphate signaling complex protein PhoU [Tissierellia bacterium]|nr:phosphate signaling complex protein PhoU [Tissierellia bacterium]